MKLGVDAASCFFLKTSAAGYELMNESQMSSTGPDYQRSRLKRGLNLKAYTKRNCTEVDSLRARPPLKNTL